MTSYSVASWPHGLLTIQLSDTKENVNRISSDIVGEETMLRSPDGCLASRRRFLVVLVSKLNC